MSNNVLTAFNDHFFEFVEDVKNVFPDDPDILTAKNAFLIARKANPKIILKIWKKLVLAGSVSFALGLFLSTLVGPAVRLEVSRLAAEEASYVQLLAGGIHSAASLALFAVNHELNKINIGFVGIMAQGLIYQDFGL
jgi:hypothetical protein